MTQDRFVFDGVVFDIQLMRRELLDGGPYSIKLSANTDSEGREYRLSRVVGFMMAMFGCSEDELARRHGLLALHDHKGGLSSAWNNPSSFASGVAFLNKAWDAEAECDHIAHVFGHHCSGEQVVEVSM